jgi:hypothetical protein
VEAEAAAGLAAVQAHAADLATQRVERTFPEGFAFPMGDTAAQVCLELLNPYFHT